MRRARTWGWTRTRLYHEPSNDLGPSSPRQSCPVCIIDTPGYDFREGQVGRIMKAAAAPVGQPWLGTLDYGHHEDRTPTYGYEPTREAAMAAFAKSWRRQ